MKVENEKTPEPDVMRAMAEFLSNLWYEEDFRDQPEYLSEIFETILLTEMGDDLDLRIRMVVRLEQANCWQMLLVLLQTKKSTTPAKKS